MQEKITPEWTVCGHCGAAGVLRGDSDSRRHASDCPQVNAK